jgi:hypothetical protein
MDENFASEYRKKEKYTTMVMEDLQSDNIWLMLGNLSIIQNM